MIPRLTYPRQGPLQEHAAWCVAAVANYAKANPQVPHDPLPEPCLAVAADNDSPCWLPEGHTGIHSWQTPIDPSDCPGCGRDTCDGRDC